jgi:hypothetical protein
MFGVRFFGVSAFSYTTVVKKSPTIHMRFSNSAISLSQISEGFARNDNENYRPQGKNEVSTTLLKRCQIAVKSYTDCNKGESGNQERFSSEVSFLHYFPGQPTSWAIRRTLDSVIIQLWGMNELFPQHLGFWQSWQARNGCISAQCEFHETISSLQHNKRSSFGWCQFKQSILKFEESLTLLRPTSIGAKRR